MSKLKGP